MVILGITTGNLLDIDPLLGPLQNNGGPTDTQALLAGSPAIDAGTSGGLNSDQRGIPRPIDIPSLPNAADGTDIGAYEFNDTGLPVASYAVIKAPVLLSNPPRIVGWFRLLATDNSDPDPLIYIKGSAGSFVAGPFHNGDQVEIAHGPSLIPRQRPTTSGGNIASIQLNGDALLWAVDSSGNASVPIKCK
jgi:hypothetical protein